MAMVKTAISMGESLFEEAEALAREMGTSRSRLFVLALEEYIRRHKTRKLRETIDAAYAEEPSVDEQDGLRLRRRQHRQMVEGEW